MKSKLTITVDSDLIPVAKQYARSKGVSLSAVIEQALREATDKSEPTFAEKWLGKFQPAHHVKPELLDDPRYAALARKYLKLFSLTPTSS